MDKLLEILRENSSFTTSELALMLGEPEDYITAQIKVEFAKEYKGKGPVLYPVSVEPAEKPEDELVYFS